MYRSCVKRFLWAVLPTLLGCQTRSAPPVVPPASSSLVSDVEQTPASVPDASTAESGPSKLTTVCSHLALESADLLEDALANDEIDRDRLNRDVTGFLETLAKCHPGEGGAWALVPLDWIAGYADFDNGDDEEVWVEGAVRLVHIDAQGQRMEQREAFEVHVRTGVEFGNTKDVSILATHDYDGDGVDEVVVVENRGGYDQDHNTYAIYSRQADDVYFYPPTDAITINTMTDYDRDGALDLVSISDYWAARTCFDMADGQRIGVPEVLFHAGSDGAFSNADDTAQRFLRAQCPAPPGELLRGGKREWELAALQRIACARLWGSDPTELDRRIRQEWRDLPLSDKQGDDACKMPLSTFTDFAAIEPPVVLRPTP